ncbi:IS1595 family transposase [Candidatus Bipolaricaulota bacterium]|nr:IS1595 family transposase [Candidatus Bipolaricaulota bacterium]
MIKNKVNIEAKIYSDTWKNYNGLEEDFKSHSVVDQDDEEYKHGKATINGIEGFWGYAKERLLTHHGVSPENFLKYLKEKEYRFNHRHLTREDFVNKMLEVLLNRGEVTP